MNGFKSSVGGGGQIWGPRDRAGARTTLGLWFEEWGGVELFVLMGKQGHTSLTSSWSPRAQAAPSAPVGPLPQAA